MKGENDGQVWMSGSGSGRDHCCRTLEVNTRATERERDWGESPRSWFLFVSLDPAVTHTQMLACPRAKLPSSCRSQEAEEQENVVSAA